VVCGGQTASKIDTGLYGLSNVCIDLDGLNSLFFYPSLLLLSISERLLSLFL
jgi:hypothetical protein